MVGQCRSISVNIGQVSSSFFVLAAGVGYTYLVTEGYTSTLGSKSAFRTESSKQQIVSVPVA